MLRPLFQSPCRSRFRPRNVPLAVTGRSRRGEWPSIHSSMSCRLRSGLRAVAARCRR
jgi:hypothetical protein